MALLKTSGLITGLSGKLGGSILGQSTTGAYIKQNAYTTQPNTPAQQVRRVEIGAVSQLWRSLTVTQQNLWNADTVNYPYTNRVGDTAYYTGYQLHNMVNLNLLLCRLTLKSVPATYVAPVTPTITFDTFSGTDLIIGWTGNASQNIFAYFVTLPLYNNLVPPLRKYLFLVSTPKPFATGAGNIYANYVQKFGIPPVGSTVYVYVKCINQNTGAPTPITNQVGLIRT